MNNILVHKNILSWVKGIFFSCFIILMALFFSEKETNYYSNLRIVNLSEVNILSLKYLWEKIGQVDVAFLTIITAIILIIFIHVVLIYQNNFEKD